MRITDKDTCRGSLDGNYTFKISVQLLVKSSSHVKTVPPISKLAILHAPL